MLSMGFLAALSCSGNHAIGRSVDTYTGNHVDFYVASVKWILKSVRDSHNLLTSVYYISCA